MLQHAVEAGVRGVWLQENVAPEAIDALCREAFADEPLELQQQVCRLGVVCDLAASWSRYINGSSNGGRRWDDLPALACILWSASMARYPQATPVLSTLLHHVPDGDPSHWCEVVQPTMWKELPDLPYDVLKPRARATVLAALSMTWYQRAMQAGSRLTRPSPAPVGRLTDAPPAVTGPSSRQPTEPLLTLKWLDDFAKRRLTGRLGALWWLPTSLIRNMMQPLAPPAAIMGVPVNLLQACGSGSEEGADGEVEGGASAAAERKSTVPIKAMGPSALAGVDASAMLYSVGLGSGDPCSHIGMGGQVLLPFGGRIVKLATDWHGVVDCATNTLHVIHKLCQRVPFLSSTRDSVVAAEEGTVVQLAVPEGIAAALPSDDENEAAVPSTADPTAGMIDWVNGLPVPGGVVVMWGGMHPADGTMTWMRHMALALGPGPAEVGPLEVDDDAINAAFHHQQSMPSTTLNLASWQVSIDVVPVSAHIEWWPMSQLMFQQAPYSDTIPTTPSEGLPDGMRLVAAYGTPNKCIWWAADGRVGTASLGRDGTAVSCQVAASRLQLRSIPAEDVTAICPP